MPFTTSTLQQMASNELRYSPKDTMKICQTLYEAGYITYMRTDSKTYSKEFVEKAHKSGKEVHVWGKVDDRKEMIRLRDLKVDNIITDYPDLWLEFLKE